MLNTFFNAIFKRFIWLFKIFHKSLSSKSVWAPVLTSAILVISYLHPLRVWKVHIRFFVTLEILENVFKIFQFYYLWRTVLHYHFSDVGFKHFISFKFISLKFRTSKFLIFQELIIFSFLFLVVTVYVPSCFSAGRYGC